MRQVILYPGEIDYWVAEFRVFRLCQPGKQKKTPFKIFANHRGYILALQENGLAVLRSFVPFSSQYGQAASNLGRDASRPSQIRISIQTATRQPHHS